MTESEKSIVLLLGGPNGSKNYRLPHLAEVGFRIVMMTDPHGSRYEKPVVYEVKEESTKRGWLAGYAGQATDEDIARWKAGPPK